MDGSRRGHSGLRICEGPTAVRAAPGFTVWTMTLVSGGRELVHLILNLFKTLVEVVFDCSHYCTFILSWSFFFSPSMSFAFRSLKMFN